MVLRTNDFSLVIIPVYVCLSIPLFSILPYCHTCTSFSFLSQIFGNHGNQELQTCFASKTILLGWRENVLFFFFVYLFFFIFLSFLQSSSCSPNNVII